MDLESSTNNTTHVVCVSIRIGYSLNTVNHDCRGRIMRELSSEKGTMDLVKVGVGVWFVLTNHYIVHN